MSAEDGEIVAFTEEDENIVVAIAESRARELCLAKMSSSHGSGLEIFSLADSHTYVETLNTLAAIDPDEILLSDSTRDGVLSQKIQSVFRGNNNTASVVFVTRSLFDQDRGVELLRRIVSGIKNVDADLLAKYTVLAASFCLIRYIEIGLGATFADSSVHLTFSSGQRDRMNIDRRTATSLEIVSSVRDGNQKESLFGVINKTKTKVGERLLRSNLLRPIYEIATLNTRLDVVDFFLKHKHIYNSIAKKLTEIPDIDSMLYGLCTVQQRVTARATKKGIDTLLMLKSLIKEVAELANLLDDGLNSVLMSGEALAEGSGALALIRAILSSLRDETLDTIKEAVAEVMNDEARFSRNSYAMRNEECFAVKSGYCQILDVARQLFISSLEEIEGIARGYETSLDAPVKVQFSARRGYYLLVTLDDTALPIELIQRVQNKKSIACTTHDIMRLSRKAQESVENCLNITFELLQATMQTARENSAALFAVADGVALLDMLGGFSQVVSSSSEPFSRPLLTDGGPLMISQGRHPVFSTSAKARGASFSVPFIPNDVSLTTDECFKVITGPNGSGKTMFMKQVALITVMAQVGMFAPAISCTINLRDRIMSRMGNAESIEHGMSSFFGEMRETAYIQDNVTPNSLVLVDELGKSTGHIDGMAIAFAIAEDLIRVQCFTLFSTHFHQLTALQDMYPRVSNVHLVTDQEHRLEFRHEVANGPCDIKYGYGVAMAELCGFPPEFIASAKKHMKQMRECFPIFIKGPQVDDALVAATNLLKHLRALDSSSTMDQDALASFKRQLLDKIPIETREKILNLLDNMDAAEGQQDVAKRGRDENSVSVGTVDAHTSVAHDKAEQQPLQYEDGTTFTSADFDRDIDIFEDLGQDATPTRGSGSSSSSSSSSTSSDESCNGVASEQVKMTIRRGVLRSISSIRAKSSNPL